MARALTRTNFHSSRLVRVLADLAVLEAAEPGMAFAEKLGLWIDFADAINLCAVHNANPAVAQTVAQDAQHAAMGEYLARVRAGLEKAISQSVSPLAGKARSERFIPNVDIPIEVKMAYEPYRRYYQAHQRDMDLKIPPLRALAREALLGASAPLQQLAALDEALEGILVERESKLLSTLPSLLEKRFGYLLKAHQQQLVNTQHADNPDLWMQPGAWLHRFCTELQTVLLAELDVRLQPTVGLVEALQNYTTKQI